MKRVKLALAIVLSLVLLCSVCPAVQADDGGASVDLTATVGLNISAVSASGIGYHGATISWKTNGDATSQVFYDTASHEDITGYAYHTAEDTELVSDRNMTLTGLASSTTYHYRVKSAIGTEFVATSGDYTFRTLTLSGGGGGGGGGVGALKIKEVATTVTETTAEIIWETNRSATSTFTYWSSPEVVLRDSSSTKHHEILLEDLDGDTQYEFKIRCEDRYGLRDTKTGEFTTLGEPPAAAFTISELTIAPSEVDIGEGVTISIAITNIGDLAGSYALMLRIDGVAEEIKKITLDAGASEEVVFTMAEDMAGSYSVEVDGLKGSFTVKEKPAPPTALPPEEAPPEAKPPVPWPLIGGVVGGAILIAAAVIYWLWRRGKLWQ